MPRQSGLGVSRSRRKGSADRAHRPAETAKAAARAGLDRRGEVKAARAGIAPDSGSAAILQVVRAAKVGPAAAAGAAVLLALRLAVVALAAGAVAVEVALHLSAPPG